MILFIINTGHAQTFQNPLLNSGADPYSTYVDGYYYYTHSMGNKIVIWKTKNLANLRKAESKTIWKPPRGKPYSKDLWAPEIHYINNRWYVYFAADDGDNNNHRMYVLESSAKNPLHGDWEFKGQLKVPSDKWAIDGNVFEYKDQLYMIWSGWEGDRNGQQDIFIAKMENPITMSGKRVMISSPTYEWEKHGDLNEPNLRHVYVNEGPQFLRNGKHLFIVFSASGCWTDYYALGLLSFTGKDNLLNASAWVKSDKPIFKQHIENGVYAPGHNSFFKSPDGKEDWILYHANANAGDGCGGKRSPRMQRLYWKEDGSPFIGEPLPTSVVLPIPGE